MADPAVHLFNRLQPKVRHHDNDRHHAQHDDDGHGALRSVDGVRLRPVDRQHRLHRHLHRRMPYEANQSPLALLPAAVERIRFRCRRHLRSWWGDNSIQRIL